MIKIFAMGLLGMMLCFVAPNPAASEEPALSAEEVKELFSGKTENATGLRKKRVPWTNYFDTDGTVRGEKAGKAFQGEWFVDTQGRLCFRWSHKDEAKCDAIIPEGEGVYLRVRDGEAVARVRLVDGNPNNF